MDQQRLIPGDATLIENIVNYLKAKGIFDEFRHECLADVDTKSSCQNLSQRVDGYTSKFLALEAWHSDLNKNELRNKLRRNLDESGMLAVGADHVVEQAINPKIHQLFLPEIIGVVHQYVKEQTELLNKKREATSSDNTSSSEKTVYDISDSKVKTSISDPIADILSFSFSKSKPTTSTHIKSESIQQKHTDFPKVEKKKEEKPIPVIEKSIHENPVENATTCAVVESKMQSDKEKEKVKKEEQEISQEVSKKAVKEELKPEKKKTEEIKMQSTDTVTAVEENKTNVSNPNKPSIIGKKDIEKNKQKLKSSTTQKPSSSSNEIKKPKKELTDKTSEKPLKSKPVKSLKESTSPTKSVSSVKSVLKEEKVGESSKSKSSDSSSSKTSESLKKSSKSNNVKKDSNSKQKGHNDKADKSKITKSSDKSDQSSNSDSTNEKIEKYKIPKSSDKSDQNIHYDSSGEKTDKAKISIDKSDQNIHYDSSGEKTNKAKISKSTDKSDQNTHYDSSGEKTNKTKISKSTDKSDQNIYYDSSNSEKASKSAQYSSSYDSSQGSDQEKSSSSSKNERQKHFYKHAQKEKSKEPSDEKDKTSCDMKRPSDNDESPSKKPKSEKSSKLEKLKDATVVEAAKINSRSNSFGSTSSVSSSSNASKDNCVSNSDESSESSLKDKKKKQVKEKDSCQNPTKVFPPPPPPPPSSSSLLCESTSAEMSSMEDTQSSTSSESSSSEAMSEEELSSDSELESKESLPITLNESTLNSSTDNLNDFYDIFLYSSSSSEFEGFEKSPEKKKKDSLEYVHDSDISVSSVHTSDLSSFDDELSDDGFSFISESHLPGRKRLTLKEAQELIKNKAILLQKRKTSPTESKSDSVPVSVKDGPIQKSSKLASSDEESSPPEPIRSLRRERKLNPRYASSEYTSIFNSKKETFITKQSSPMKSNSYNSSPNSDSKYGRKVLLSEKSRLPKKTSLEAKINAGHQVEQLEKTKSNAHNSESYVEKESCDSSGMSSADEMDSIMNKEIFQENDKITDSSDNNHLKNHLKLKPQNNSKIRMNSLKRKLSVSETAPVKRPCSRSSVDSSSSEFVPNENKPFNSEKQSIIEDKILRDAGLKGSDLTDGIKKDPFCKQRTNNNGDILGQKDIFPKNSHGKTINIAEKKTSESETRLLKSS